MVWNTSSSMLYQAVERHNSGALPEEDVCRDKVPSPECSCKKEEKAPCRDTSSACSERNRTCDYQSKANRCSVCERSCNTPHNDLISRLTNDRDMLLIAALLLILWHEKADMKLILALAYVLLA